MSDEGVEDLGGTVTDTEQAADFARVAAMVAEAEPAAAGPGAVAENAEPERPAMDAAESMAGLLVALSSVAGFSGMKNTAALWTPENCEQCAQKAVPVLRKYPWGARVLEFFETGAWVEEMALGAFLLTMGFATRKAVKSDLEKPAEAAPAKRESQPAQGAATVTAPAPADLGNLVEVHGRAN